MVSGKPVRCNVIVAGTGIWKTEAEGEADGCAKSQYGAFSGFCLEKMMIICK